MAGFGCPPRFRSREAIQPGRKLLHVRWLPVASESFDVFSRPYQTGLLALKAIERLS
jgi:hypothetical protein